MNGKIEDKHLVLTFTEDETIVFFEWLASFNKKDNPSLFSDAEEILFYDLETTLEKILTVPFDKKYKEILTEARKRIIEGQDVRGADN
ncbi:hypothetical protein Dip510_001873 [Elusimicrobium posterum]|uniref:hypothetical protein n=1 Tax=Elusimicrobium posterum TaxID=3116653 RepID=UPI003C791D4E